MKWLGLLRSELLVQSRDRLFIILLFVAPAFLILILHDAWKAMLSDQTEADIQIFVGMAVFFGYSVATYAGHAFNREVEWGSLENTLSLPMSQLGLVISKAIPPVALGAVQIGIALGLVTFVGDIQVLGWGVAMAFAIGVVSAAAAAVIGVASVAMTATSAQSSQLTWMLLLLGGTLGGALVHETLLPDWSRAASFLTPQYWSVRGMRGALQGEWDIAVTSCLSLLAFSFVAGLICLRMLWPRLLR